MQGVIFFTRYKLRRHFWGTLGPTIPTFGLVLMKVSLRLPKQSLLQESL
jgi:hypothetical protein